MKSNTFLEAGKGMVLKKLGRIDGSFLIQHMRNWCIWMPPFGL
jgi:hypothetical protein